MNITFDDSAKTFILDIFGATVNKDGIIVEKNNIEQKVLDRCGEEISLKDFAAIINVKGSPVLIKSDIISLIETIDSMKK